MGWGEHDKHVVTRAAPVSKEEVKRRVEELRSELSPLELKLLRMSNNEGEEYR